VLPLRCLVMPRQRLVSALVGTVLALAVVLVGTTGAPAATTTTAPPNQGTPIGSGIRILGATITAPDGAIRKLDSNQAAAFIQAWLPTSIFGKPVKQRPPAGVPIYHISVPYTYLYGTQKAAPMRVLFAVQGTSAWVGMPPQALWPGAWVATEWWLVAPERTKPAFEGKLQAVKVADAPPPTTPPTTAKGTERAAPAHKSSSSTPTAVWIALVVLLAVLAGAGGIFFLTSRSRARTAV
jgi:hypothetical protein